ADESLASIISLHQPKKAKTGAERARAYRQRKRQKAKAAASPNKESPSSESLIGLTEARFDSGVGMADITQNFSQLLLTYGSGAMMDLPENAVLVAGLQDWDYKGSSWKPVEEGRLARLLRRQFGEKW